MFTSATEAPFHEDAYGEPPFHKDAYREAPFQGEAQFQTEAFGVVFEIQDDSGNMFVNTVCF